jgi:hypothetical protein
MALRKFNCESCQHEWSRLKVTEDTCPKCGKASKASLPSEGSTAVYETRDRYRGAQIRKGQEQRMKKRMNDHHDKYELAEKIDKYGMDDAKRYGWLKRQKKV